MKRKGDKVSRYQGIIIGLFGIMLIWISCAKQAMIKKYESKIITYNRIPEMKIKPGIQEPIQNLTISTVKIWNISEKDDSIFTFNTKNGKKKYNSFYAFKMNSTEDFYFLTKDAIFITDKQLNWKDELKFRNIVTHVNISFDIDENDEIFLFEQFWKEDGFAYLNCYHYSKDLKFKKKYVLGKTRGCHSWFVDGGIIWGFYNGELKKFLEYDENIPYNPLSRKMLKYKIKIKTKFPGVYFEDKAMEIYGTYEMKEKIKKQELSLRIGWTNYDKNNNPEWHPEWIGGSAETIGVDKYYNIYFTPRTLGKEYDVYLLKCSIFE